jgi:hypothetical protein
MRYGRVLFDAKNGAESDAFQVSSNVSSSRGLDPTVLQDSRNDFSGYIAFEAGVQFN